MKELSAKVVKWIDDRVVAPIKRVVQAGITPHQMTVSLAVGCICGVVPFLFTYGVVCILPFF